MLAVYYKGNFKKRVIYYHVNSGNNRAKGYLLNNADL